MRFDEVQRRSHCVYRIHYHGVWPVKYRKALLDRAVEQCFLEVCRGIQERYEIVFEQVGFDRDHVHVLCSAAPRYSPGQVIRVIKSITAREIFVRFPGLRVELWGGELWTDGYYVATIGEGGNRDVIEAYIKEQGQKPEDVQLRLFEINKDTPPLGAGSTL